MAKVRQLAIEKGYTLSNPWKNDANVRWVSYALQKNGPVLSFCDSTLSAMNLTRPSSLHEITSTIKDWKNAYGEPQVVPNIYYSQGTQLSSVNFKWFGEDNIERNVMISQFGETQTDIVFGYSYINHPCRP
jgi:hypothetical protein